MPEGTVESAHRALIGVRAQDLLGEPAATGPQLNSAGDSLASGEVQGGHVKVDGSADQLGQDWREVQVQHEPGSRGEGRLGRSGAVPLERAGDRPPLGPAARRAVRARPGRFPFRSRPADPIARVPAERMACRPAAGLPRWELVGRIEDATRSDTGRMAKWILDWTAGFTWSPGAAAVLGSLRRGHSSRTGPGWCSARRTRERPRRPWHAWRRTPPRLNLPRG